MTRTRRRTARLITAVALAVPALLGSVATSGASPKDNLQAGQAKLHDLQHQLDVLAEQVNTAQARLAEVQARYDDALATKEQAEKLAADTRAELSARAVASYEGAGSQLEGLLGAENFNDFSDRLQYAGALAQSDADLAAKADAAGTRAQWAADQYDKVATERKSALVRPPVPAGPLPPALPVPAEEGRGSPEGRTSSGSRRSALRLQRPRPQRRRHRAAAATAAGVADSSRRRTPPARRSPSPQPSRRSASLCVGHGEPRVTRSTAPASPRGRGARRACTCRTRRRCRRP